MHIANEGFAWGWKSRLRWLPAAIFIIAVVGLFSASPKICGVLARSPKPPGSTSTCADCHGEVTSSYTHAGMQHALQPPGIDPVLEAHPSLSTEQNGYVYSVQTHNGQSSYTVSDARGSLTLPIRWTFGAHSQTWVLEKDGEFYEGLVSYYQLDQSLATTPGDEKITPHTLTEAMGRKLSFGEALQCFNCHATGAVSDTSLTLDKLQPGVGCERCHEGTAQHLADASRGKFNTLPKSLKRMNAADAANFCGQCHRTWDAAVRNHWHGVSDVRFQPYRLENSHCFMDDRRISCVACHDPHQAVHHDAAFYDAKCLACHERSKSSNDSFPIKICTVSKTNCVTCHMPKVELPGGHAVFTDHEIRIVRPGDPYPD